MRNDDALFVTFAICDNKSEFCYNISRVQVGDVIIWINFVFKGTQLI